MGRAGREEEGRHLPSCSIKASGSVEGGGGKDADVIISYPTYNLRVNY